MTGAGGATGRGVRAAALIGAASAAAWKATHTTTTQWYAVGMLVLSETLIDAGLSPRRPKEIRHPDGRTETVTLGAIASHRPLLALRERILDDLLDAALHRRRDRRPPGATANRADTQGRKSPDGVKPEGGMIRI